MTITKRTIWKIYVLAFVTFGIYAVYLFIQTKRELNKSNNEDIPTC